mmetsp:Transcript_17756/g.38385  ORF Transcript_17756/g.38385 Transcript_17756/m.38385 type:complete len:99 (+) Transcript_17756:1430-1726(+)
MVHARPSILVPVRASAYVCVHFKYACVCASVCACLSARVFVLSCMFACLRVFICVRVWEREREHALNNPPGAQRSRNQDATSKSATKMRAEIVVSNHW